MAFPPHFIGDREFWGDGFRAFGADALFFSPATFPWDNTFGNVKKLEVWHAKDGLGQEGDGDCNVPHLHFHTLLLSVRYGLVSSIHVAHSPLAPISKIQLPAAGHVGYEAKFKCNETVLAVSNDRKRY